MRWPRYARVDFKREVIEVDFQRGLGWKFCQGRHFILHLERGVRVRFRGTGQDAWLDERIADRHLVNLVAFLSSGVPQLDNKGYIYRVAWLCAWKMRLYGTLRSGNDEKHCLLRPMCILVGMWTWSTRTAMQIMQCLVMILLCLPLWFHARKSAKSLAFTPSW